MRANCEKGTCMSGARTSRLSHSFAVCLSLFLSLSLALSGSVVCWMVAVAGLDGANAVACVCDTALALAWITQLAAPELKTPQAPVLFFAWNRSCAFVHVVVHRKSFVVEISSSNAKMRWLF